MGTTRKVVLGVVLVLLGAVDLTAQVACSPEVDASACKTVAIDWDVISDNPALTGGTVSVELVTPAEYAARKAQIRKEDEALGMQCDGCPPSYVGAPKYQEFRNVWSDNILFLRAARSRTPFPSKVLVSMEVFADFATDKNGLPMLEDFQNEQGKGKRPVMDHKFHAEKTLQVLNFIGGYFAGMGGSFFDSEVVPLKDFK